MRPNLVCTVAALLLSSVAGARSYASDGRAVVEVQSTLDNLDQWLGKGPNAEAWENYLKTSSLREQVARGDAADKAVVAESLSQFQSQAPGLNLPKFSAARDALAAWIDELSLPKAGDLPAAIAAAKSSFTAPPATSVDDAKAALHQAQAKLANFLARSGANGVAWKEYLQSNMLDTELKKKDSSIESLRQIAARYAANEQGLEMPAFTDVRAALLRTIDALETSQTADLKARYEQQLDALAKSLSEYANNPTEEGALAVGGQLGWLERSGQAAALIRAVRHNNSNPNFHLQASQALIAAGVQRDVDDTMPLRDNILGTDIHGTGHTKGRITVELIPDRHRAIIDAVLKGVTTTKTVGYNGPATIHASGTTEVDGRKRVIMNSEGLVSLPPTANAVMHNRITGVSAGRGGLVQRMAEKQVHAKKSSAEAVAAEHAEQRICDRVEREAAPELQKTAQKYLDKFRNPLLRHNIFPDVFDFSTTPDNLSVVWLQADTSQIASSTAPPAWTDGHALALQIHESLVNNLASSLLSGRTMTDDEMREIVIDWRGSLPDNMKGEDEEPWSITFANVQPVSIKFHDGGYTVTVRGKRYTSGDRKFKAMNVTAVYKAEIHGKGSRLVRQGDLQIAPPGFVPGKQTLSAGDITLKKLLEKKFSKVFEPEVVRGPLELGGKWKAAGPLPLKQLTADHGWLVLGYGLEDATKVAQAFGSEIR